MGSSSFYEEHFDTRPVEEVYKTAVEEARAEYGWDPYNGTISTTAGVRAVPGLVTLKQAYEIAHRRIDALHKWDACEAIPYSAPPVHEYGDRYDVEVDVTLPAPAMTEQVVAAIARVAKVKPDEVGETSWLRRDLLPKVRVAATDGERSTRYFIVHEGQLPAPIDDGYASQAEARAALLSGAGFRSVQDVLEVVAITRRASGSGLVRAEVASAKVRVHGKATIQPIIKRRKPDLASQAGWLFYGWAAS